MSNSSGLYSFQGQAGADPNAMLNLQQYIAQGQQGIQPGQQQVAASDPLATAAQSLFGKALANAAQQPQPGQLPPDISQQALAQGAQNGSVGPTQQNLALANALQQNPFANLPNSYGIQ